ncbi:MAG: transporter [Pseudomonadota bacterium]
MRRPFNYVAFDLLAAAGRSFADTPAFDRPGIAISTSTIPRGGVALELGVPDFQQVSDSGSRSTIYSLDVNLRAGLSDHIELQVATPLINDLHMRAFGLTDSAYGTGDLSLSLKAALPSSAEDFSWATLANATFATGQSQFTSGKSQYSLATAMSLKLNDMYSAGAYIKASLFAGRVGYTLSPNLNFGLSDALGAYLEAGYNHVPGNSDATIAGGGLAWMATSRVQLDLSVDFGMTRHSPDVQGGFGVSLYFD